MEVNKAQSELDNIFKQLQSPNYDARSTALWSLQKHPSRNNISSKQLEQLRDLMINVEYYEVRNEIVFLLSIIDPINSLTIIASALDDTRLGVQLSVVEALSRIGDESSIPTLEILEKKGSQLPHDLQEEVIQAINRIKGRLGDHNYI